MVFCKHTDTDTLTPFLLHTNTFSFVGHPWGRASSTRDCGDKWGWDGGGIGGDVEKRVGSKQETLMKYEGLSMAAWFLPSTTSPPRSPAWALPAWGTQRGRWVTLERKDCKSHAEWGKKAKTILTITPHLLRIFIIITLQFYFKCSGAGEHLKFLPFSFQQLTPLYLALCRAT